MRALGGFLFALLLSTGLLAQNRAGFVNSGPNTVYTFPSVIHPGGTSALPGVQRTTGSILHPGGGGPQIGIPGVALQGQRGQNGNSGRRSNGAVYAYPV